MRMYRLATAISLIAIVVAAGCGSSDDGDTTTAAEPTVSSTATAAATTASGTTTAAAPAASGTTDTAAPAARADWASSVCGALATWKSDIAAVGTSLANGDGLSETALQDAADQLDTATSTLTSSLKGVGAPPTPDGPQAKQAVDQLSDDLNAGVDQIKSDTANVTDAAGFATAAAAVAATARTMAGQVTSTVSELRSLDANGDWEKAFSETASCDSLATP
jgi:hypothetical protein